MKKIQFRSLAMGIILGVGITATSSVFASNAISAILNNNVKYVVDGSSVSASAPALVANNSTYLKVRELADILGYDVAWDGKTSTVTFNSQDTASQNQQSNNSLTSTDTQQPSAPTQSGYTFSKLPVSITKGDYTMTIESIKKDEDGSYIMTINTKNLSGKETKLVKEGNAAMNVGIDGKKYGTAIGFNVDLGQSFSDVEKSHEIKLSKTYASGAKNFMVSLGFNTITYFSNNENVFTFYIDTDGIFN